METNSHPEAVASTVKQGQYSPRKRKDTAPKVNPQLAIELFFQEMGRIEAYTKRIEDATSRKVQIDGKSLESAENRLKNVLSDFERQGYRMKNGGYVRKYMNKFDQIQALLGLTEKEKSQILSINMANNPSRLYKEVWIGLGGTQSAVYATEVSAEEYLAYTTEETEKVEVYRLAEKLGDDIEAAIRQLAERRRNKE